MNYEKYATLGGRLVIVGFGSVAQGVLSLILRHLAVEPQAITIVTADDHGRDVARACGVTDFRALPLTAANTRDILTPLLGPRAFLLNLSYDVSSIALIELCHELDVPYLDACIEPWAGGYYDSRLTPTERSNYGLREQALAVNARANGRRPTCVVAHGVNPGLVSHFTKRALLAMAGDVGLRLPPPAQRDDWARLAQRLGIRVIHVAERDFQRAAQPKAPGEFVNTWSTGAFVGEGSQPAELGWGTHEKRLPAAGHRHPYGSQAAIYLERPGVSVRVRSWTPMQGPYHGFLITHAEAISIADYLTLRADGVVTYRPTVHYAYHPCDDAVLSIFEYCGSGYRLQPRGRLLREDIVGGTDELGVLLCGHPKGVYWYGSRLAIEQARRLAPYNNATTLQTAAGVLGGLVWASENPGRGVVEPECMDHERVMQVAEPYLGQMIGVWGDWSPLQGRERFFPEALDRDDPWQFANIVVE
jgi:homospermidine synthase